MLPAPGWSDEVAGSVTPVAAEATGLAAGTRYMGSVAYSGAPNLPVPTIIRIDR